MILRIIGICISISISLLLFSQQVLSQEKLANKTETADPEKIEPMEKDPSKLWVDLSGLMYCEWGYFTGFNNSEGNRWNKQAKWGIDTTNFPTLTGTPPTNYRERDNNTFRLQRAYLTLRKEIGDIFSVKVTTDIQPTGQDFIYLKFAFVQLNKEFITPYGPITLKAQLGKIATPVQGMTDWLNDLRWIGDNYLGASKFILNGKSFDNPADLGGMFSISFFKFVRLEYTYTNGEGYRFDNSETYAGKAHTLLASVNPEFLGLKEVFVNFYGRWEDTNRNKLDQSPLNQTPQAYPIKYCGVDTKSYMGVGAAWHSEPVKLGLNFFMPEMQFSKTVFILPITGYAPRHKEKFYLVDSWFNFNLGAIVRPAPLLIAGRCAYGREFKSLIGNSRQGRETLVAGGGAGYQFNQYFRMMVYYEHIIYHLSSKINDFTKRDPSLNNNVYIKAEVKY
jgi:hypothetical protein